MANLPVVEIISHSFSVKLEHVLLNGAKESREDKLKLFWFGFFSVYMTLYPYILVKCLICDFVFPLFHSPFLTWRDIQHIIVRTSRAGHLNANDWKTNAAGYKGESFLSSLRSQTTYYLIFLFNPMLCIVWRSFRLNLKGPIFSYTM